MMRPGAASPRLAAAGPGGLSLGGDSPSKRGPGLMASLGLGGSASTHGAARAGAQGPSRVVALLVLLSVLLNVATVGILLTRCSGSNASSSSVTNALNAHVPTVLATSDAASSSSVPAGYLSPELAALKDSELASLQESLTALQNEKAEALASEKDALARVAQAIEERTKLAGKVEQLQAQVAAGGNAPAAAAGAGGADECPCRQHSRLSADDKALEGDRFDLASHEFEWKCDDELTRVPGGNQTFCPETATSEQYFQLTFFDRPGAGSKVAVRKGRPVSPSCVQLPPRNYRWPQKHAPIPVPLGSEGVHWPNLRVATLKDLLVFNRGTPKNLYHFNASFYDYEQESIVAHAARYIPFDQKVRVMLDIGSGGGSLGLVLKRRYDVQVVSTVFADWPYCEYITERGNLCMYLDAMEAMPFAKFSYDVLHSSWVFHALLNSQLRHTYLEQNRILRPGGYMWLNGGWSLSQVATLEQLFITELGYTAIYNHKRPVARPGVTKFDTIPFELEWEVILVKPMRADEKTCRVAQAQHNPESHGRSLL